MCLFFDSLLSFLYCHLSSSLIFFVVVDGPLGSPLFEARLRTALSISKCLIYWKKNYQYNIILIYRKVNENKRGSKSPEREGRGNVQEYLFGHVNSRCVWCINTLGTDLAHFPCTHTPLISLPISYVLYWQFSSPCA